MSTITATPQTAAPVTDPVARLNTNVRQVVSRFSFERPTEIVGRCQSGDASDDVDIHDGTIVTAHGYARLALHKPTGTICLFASKASTNLQGERAADRSIMATTEGLAKSYIVAAYRTDGTAEDIVRMAPFARRALRRFNEDLGERSEKHFTLYGAKTVNSRGQETEFYTNGRLAYRIEKYASGWGYKVRFYAPTKRKDGSFVPVELERKTLSGRFGSVSRVISDTRSYEQARHDMAVHWQRISSRLWDEKSIYDGEGLYMNAKKGIARFFNHVAEKGLQLGLVTGLIGLGMGLVSAKYGILGGLAAAVTHTLAHYVLDESYSASNATLQQVREAKQRLNIDAYPYGEDVANHFKIQDRQNITKLCAKTDMQRFSGDEFEWLTAARSGMMLDHEKVTDGFRPSSLRAHLLFVHQRGFSSSCTLPDPRTRLDIFQSGLVRLMHEKEDGKVVIYSRYRPEACLENNLRLPQEKIEKMGTDIIRFEYDRKRENFYHAFEKGPAPVSFDEMMQDIDDNLLLRGVAGITAEVREQSIQSIRESFTLHAAPGDGAATRKSKLYMGGNPPPLPPLQVLKV